MSPIVAAFLRSAVLPATLVGIGLLALGGQREPLRTRLQALVIGLGFCLGNYLLIDRMHVPPGDVTESFFSAALILVIFTLVGPKPVGARYLVRSLFVIAVGFVVLFHIGASLQNAVHQRNLLAFFFLGLGLWSILERKAATLSSLALIAMPLVSATGVSVLILLRASASMSQMVSIICTILGAAGVLALVKPTLLSKNALIPFLSVFIVAFMASGHFYQDINPWHMVYLCWPFLLLWIRDWMPLPKSALGETIPLVILSVLPIAYFLWTVFQSAGPLY